MTRGSHSRGSWLDLWEDSVGPAFEAETIPTDAGQNVAVEIRSGVLNTMSIGFDDLSQITTTRREPLYTSERRSSTRRLLFCGPRMSVRPSRRSALSRK